MLKHLCCSCLGLLVFPLLALASETDQHNYFLYKLYPSSAAQIEFLKQVVHGSCPEYEYFGHPPAIVTPLSTGKTVYVLVPKSANRKFQKQVGKQHLKSVLVELTTVQQLNVDNNIHKANSFPESPWAKYLIESPRVTNWGSWGVWGECQPGEFVVGMKLKTEPEQGLGDDSALNAIRLLCAAPGSHNFKEVQSLEGPWGQFGRTFYCPEGSQVSGFELRSERSQGAGDDTAANNLRILCSNPSNENQNTIEGDGTQFGDWSGVQKCLNGQAVCGLRTQVEPEIGIGDDTSLNNVDMVCCDIHPAPSQSEIQSAGNGVPPGLIDSILDTAERYAAPFTSDSLNRLYSGIFGSDRAPITFDVTIYNTLRKTFQLTSNGCAAHASGWSHTLFPEHEIPPHKSVAFGAESNVGLNCRVEYNSTDGTTHFWISVTNPYSGHSQVEINQSSDIRIVYVYYYRAKNNEGRFVIEKRRRSARNE